MQYIAPLKVKAWPSLARIRLNALSSARCAQQFLCSLVVVVVMVGCGGGGGGETASSPPATTTISGYVSDDPIAGATVTATSLDSGAQIGTATTAADGRFAIAAPTASFGAGFLLRSSGGTMNGADFTGSLTAIYATNAIPAQANATLVTTALVDATSKTTQFTGTTLEKHENLKSSAIARGVVPADYAAAVPAMDSLPRMQADVAAFGPTQALASLSDRLASAPQPGGCGSSDDHCVTDIGLNQSLAVTLRSGATVTAGTGMVSNCRADIKYDLTSQTLTVNLESIPSTAAGLTTPLLQCKLSGSIVLALPAVAAEAPAACVGDAKLPYCVTVGAGITPSYHFDDGTYRHRVGKSTQSWDATVNPVSGLTGQIASLKLKRSYGAVLQASQFTQSLAENQWKDRTPVILVHGFAPGGGLGGGSGTWGLLPSLITQDSEKVVVLEFRWITDASFTSVAPELAKAVEYAAASTGKKVHILAHSFGGVLARTMLQNLNADPAIRSAAQKVATLITVGTPHSGIANDSDYLVRDLGRDVVLPRGWDLGIPRSSKFCEQASCFQAGQDVTVAKWALSELKQEAGTTFDPSRGYVIARLSKLDDYPFPPGLKVSVLIGTTASVGPLGRSWDDGDGLISYYGQRFSPRPPASLLSGASAGAAEVTEQILGLSVGSDAKPGSTGSIPAVSLYAKGGTAPQVNVSRWGYSHIFLLAPFGNSEVAIPNGCGDADTCKHDTWVNAKQFWAANPVGCIGPKILEAGICVDPPPSIASINPGTATSGVSTIFTVTGEYLPLTAVLSLQDGVCATPTARTSTGFTTTCTPSGNGQKAIGALTAPGGSVIDARFITVVAAASLVSSVTPSSATAGVPALFTVTGDRLPLTATLGFQDGNCDTPTNRTSTGFTLFCTPGSSGVKTISVLDSVGGSVIDATRTVTIAGSTATSALYDSFDGNSIDTSKWSAVLHPTYPGTTVTVSAGELRTTVGAFVHTGGKVTFIGSKIVVEGVMGDAEASMLLLDSFNSATGFSPDVIQGSDTTYRGWGFDVQTTGRYAIVGPTTAGSITIAEGVNVLVNTTHKTEMLYRRLTIEGDVVTFERGANLGSISERLSTRMASSITGRPMTLMLGTGVGPYTPARFDWVRVTVSP